MKLLIQPLGLLLAILICLPFSVSASRYSDIDQEIASGNFDSALAMVDNRLSANPNNPELQFLKANILERLGYSDEPVNIYIRLTQTHPEMPEPHNNLAIHYANTGNLEQAVEALEAAIRTHPSYATAYQNLISIYDQLASQSYKIALGSEASVSYVELASLDSAFSLDTNPNLKEQYAAVETNEAHSSSQPSTVDTSPTQDATISNSVSITEIDTRESSQAGSQTESEPNASQVSSIEQEQPTETANTNSDQTNDNASDSENNASTNSSTDSGQTTEDTNQSIDQKQVTEEKKNQIIRQLQSWAAAWSSQSVDDYLSHYSDQFVPRENITVDEWRAQRRNRLVLRDFIEVNLSQFNVEIDNESATANFTQHYKSNVFEDTIRKTMRLEQVGDQWLITREQI